jgi:hypothetical protein
MSLNDFKALVSADDREDRLSRFVLISATYTIEEYCRRRFLRKDHTEYLDFMGDGLFPLREYPVRGLVSVHYNAGRVFSTDSLLASGFYRCIPETGSLEDTVHCLSIDPPAGMSRGEKVIRVRYEAGYGAGEIPPDLAGACLELAAWNMARYRGRRIGTTGNVWGSGKDGEHLEASMPENVRLLLEPYRRRTI